MSDCGHIARCGRPAGHRGDHGGFRVPAPTAYEQWVGRVAEALHEDCRLEWQAIAVADPTRQVTKHFADAHYGQAHDLVRRLRLADTEGADAAR